MSVQIITLCYRKIIDTNAAKAWDKLVFDSSYLEYRMQAQTLSAGTEITSYSELVQKLPEAKNLAGRVVPAIAGYVQQLNSIIPDMLNNLGKRFLKFYKYELEIINSDINDKTKHQIAINFYSEPMVWHSTIGNYLLLSAIKNVTNPNGDLQTHLYQLQSYVNINTLKQQ